MNTFFLHSIGLVEIEIEIVKIQLLSSTPNPNITSDILSFQFPLRYLCAHLYVYVHLISLLSIYSINGTILYNKWYYLALCFDFF